MSQAPSQPPSLAALQPRDCPVCSQPASAAAPFLDKTFDESRLTKDSFASRKLPEYMSYKLVRCHGCTTVFASEAPDARTLAHAYHEADYDTAREATDAATTYRRAIEPRLATLTDRGIALEIGTGTGVFLTELQRMGFREAVGIEPSPAAIAAADPAIAPAIREGVFTGDEYPPASLAFIGCFQTMEHVPDPRGLVEQSFRMLQPGGILAMITHDYTAPLNRTLGRRSPIIDIEHVQLFCPAALRTLVTQAGFGVVALDVLRNTYPAAYWSRLVPLPATLKSLMLKTLDLTRLGRIPLTINVGNLLTVAQKPG